MAKKKKTKKVKRAVSKTKKESSTTRKPSSKGGRPSKYDKKYCQAIIDYFDGEPYTDIELPHYKTTGKGKNKIQSLVWTDYKRVANKLPTLVGFAKHIGVTYNTVYNWQLKGHGSYKEEFFNAFTHAKALQKDFLIQNGLQGLYNPLFAKFTAINITDMEDVKIIGGDEERPITIIIKGKKERNAGS